MPMDNMIYMTNPDGDRPLTLEDVQGVIDKACEEGGSIRKLFDKQRLFIINERARKANRDLREVFFLLVAEDGPNAGASPNADLTQQLKHKKFHEMLLLSGETLDAAYAFYQDPSFGDGSQDVRCEALHKFLFGF